jgi:hypothetical protein
MVVSSVAVLAQLVCVHDRTIIDNISRTIIYSLDGVVQGGAHNTCNTGCIADGELGHRKASLWRMATQDRQAMILRRERVSRVERTRLGQGPFDG